MEAWNHSQSKWVLWNHLNTLQPTSLRVDEPAAQETRENC